MSDNVAELLARADRRLAARNFNRLDDDALITDLATALREARMTTTVQARDRVIVRTAFDRELERIAVSAPEMSDFLIVRVCSPEEWEASQAEGRPPHTTPWPAEDVRVVTDLLAAGEHSEQETT
jgi:hypothetical protein